MSLIWNWSKADRKTYQNEKDENIELRLFNMSETEERFDDKDGWTLVLFYDDEAVEVIDEGVDGFQAARRAATAWVRSHPFVNKAVTA